MRTDVVACVVAWIRLPIAVLASVPMLVLADMFSYSHVDTDDQIACGLVVAAVVAIVGSAISAWRTPPRNSRGVVWTVLASFSIVVLVLFGGLCAVCIPAAGLP